MLMSFRVLLAAGFAAVYCVLTSSMYFTVRFALRSAGRVLAEGSEILPHVLRQVAVPAALFGLILGGIGALSLNGFSLVRGTVLRAGIAAVVGGLLGCVPVVCLPPAQEFETPLPLLPCIVIGSTCAMAWMLTERLAKR